MYEELVKRLRNRANGSYEEKCEGCEFTEDFPPCVHCTIKAFNDAADAIEGLSKLAHAIPRVCECCVGCELEKKNGGCDHAFVLSPKRAMQCLSKPRWIPVTERLPEEDTLVLVWRYNGLPYVSRRTDSTYWLGLGRDSGITHWMPLPSTEGLNET